MQKYLVFMSMGFELIGSVLIAIYLGKYLEEKFNLSNLVTVGLIFIFIGAWITHIVYMLKKLNTPKSEE